MYGYGPTSPPLTNNPFTNDPNHPSNRFPDISSPSVSAAYSQWPNSNSNPNGYPTQQGGFQQQQYQQQYPQQQQPQLGALNTSYVAQTGGGGGYLNPLAQSIPQFGTVPPVPFQPTSSFGQQIAANISGSSYNYLSGQATGLPQQQQLGHAQQQIAQNPGYVAQLDPYGPLAQWDGTLQQRELQQQQYQNSLPTGSHINTPLPSNNVSATGEPHPREFIRKHKAEIESWDNYAWKQLLNSFESLKGAWDTRKTEIGRQLEQLKVQLNYAGYYQQQVQIEVTRVQGLYKEAESHFDSVAASTFQMQEVFQGYRQSGDLASKRRVREATNAALQSLPDWPAPAF